LPAIAPGMFLRKKRQKSLNVLFLEGRMNSLLMARAGSQRIPCQVCSCRLSGLVMSLIETWSSEFEHGFAILSPTQHFYI
jgi:hypothetical protein